MLNEKELARNISFASLGNLNCEWRVMLGEKQMTPEEFNVYLENTKWLTEFKQTQKILKAIKKPPKQISKFEAIRASLLNEPLFLGSDMIQKFKTMLNQPIRDRIFLAFLTLFMGTSRIGIQWLYSRLTMGFNPILADEMGLGKSLQTILALKILPNQKKQSLIVCPASVAYNWVNEFNKFSPNTTVSIWKKDGPRQIL